MSAALDQQWVVFSLDGNRYALPLIAVERIVRAAHVTPLPRAPDMILGALDVAGNVLPVFNVRRRFCLAERDIDPRDQFLIARSVHRRVVLVIDCAHGVLELPATAVIDAASITQNISHIRGVLRQADGLVMIHDLDLFLSPDEAHRLDEALGLREALRQDAPRAV